MRPTGLSTERDQTRWQRPLSLVMLGVFIAGLLLLLFGAAGSPLFSLAVIAVSAALLVIDFNIVRNQATEDDAIWLATGIFVSIVNLFLSFLNLFGRR
jgi:modulator of FtsH protease